MKHLTLASFALFLLNVILAPSALHAQGSLTPPGAPASTMKSLEQIEPRTAIGSLPFVISQPGSYYLTTNLTDTLGTNGIIVQSDNVTIDLAGFTLTGTGGGPLNRSAIYAANVPGNNLTVCNGTIRGWGFSAVHCLYIAGCHLVNLHIFGNNIDGVSVGKGSVIENCSAANNGGTGFYLDEGGVIKNCASMSNAGYGIELLSGGTMENCTTTGNGQYGIAGWKCVTIRGCSSWGNADAGISVEGNSTIVDCTANTNGATGYFPHGIHAQPNCTVSRCTATGNAHDGIVVLDGSTVENCTVSLNNSNGITAGIGSTVRNCTARGNGSSGIEVPNDCLVIGNHCTGNGLSTGTGAGIHTTIAGNRIEGNSTIYNQRGLWIEGGANLVVRNSSRYNPNGTGSNNFVITSGNMVGPTNMLASGTITNTSPWANFSY